MIGIESDPATEVSFRVGGRVSSLRAEAASLLALLEKVQLDKPLLIITDS